LRSDHVQTQWDNADAPFPSGRRQLIVEAAGDCAHLRLSLFERHRRPKSSNDEPRVSATEAPARIPILRSRVRLPHVGIEPRDLETSGEDADDLKRKPVEQDGRSDRIVRAPETGLPKSMTDQDEPLPLLGFFGRKATSLHGLDAEE
jgi:hypothetical protein